MPIYMDRHDLSEKVTAEIVAEFHKADLEIQDKFGCRALTYWFDGRRRTAFCLIEAPNKKCLEKMHRFAHGQVPNQIIQVDPQIVSSFLGRIEDPEKARNTALNIINDPAFRVIMVVELDTNSPKKYPPEKQNSLWDKFSKKIPNLLDTSCGTIVKQAGNYFLISYKSVSVAVDDAFRINSAMKKDAEKNSLNLKIGLSAGVPVTDKKLFFGDAIKLADRMCKVIKGTIIVSSEIKELYDSENSKTLNKEDNLVPLTQPEEEFLTHLMDFTESTWYNPNLKVNDLCKCVNCSKSMCLLHN